MILHDSTKTGRVWGRMHCIKWIHLSDCLSYTVCKCTSKHRLTEEKHRVQLVDFIECVHRGNFPNHLRCSLSVSGLLTRLLALPISPWGRLLLRCLCISSFPSFLVFGSHSFLFGSGWDFPPCLSHACPLSWLFICCFICILSWSLFFLSSSFVSVPFMTN